eukprot:CAMPEP_0116071796 /NCGR_PEP_ID=MMETSP0322-20121206/14040_1 /TAXON_ID=163516 /ORGANISM="Leptocylindrus danicus var. apora, Strain B651" /LENGTH=228 /DNA_ID=CAMNT_0003560307 /DNA_START=115 /DNA_END=802 /DNA_ORIENTATION=-
MSETETLGSDLTFYLNFLVLNASEVVQEGASAKMGGFLGRMAAVAIDADAKVSEQIATQLSTEIPVLGVEGGVKNIESKMLPEIKKTLMEKLVKKQEHILKTSLQQNYGEMGLDMTVKTVFKQGPMIVFKITINGAEPVKLITSAKGEEAGAHFENIIAAMDVLGVEGGVKNIESKMLPEIKKTLMEKLVEKIPAQMAEKGLKVECTSMNPAEEANFFFDSLEALASA